MAIWLFVLLGILFVIVAGFAFALRNPLEYVEVHRDFRCPVRDEPVAASFLRDVFSRKDQVVLSCSGRGPDEKCGEECLEK
jgi:hypothetical protein